MGEESAKLDGKVAVLSHGWHLMCFGHNLCFALSVALLSLTRRRRVRRRFHTQTV